MNAGGQTVLLLLLLETPGIGPSTLAGLLRRHAALKRTPEQLLALSPESLSEEYGLPISSAVRLSSEIRTNRERAESAAKWLSLSGVSLITFQDAAYPARLHERLEDPPPALFAYGAMDLLSQNLFAAANSNGAPEAALSAVDSACETAVEAGWSLVTGHNRPGYQRPALAVRRNGGRIVYVLDRGLLHGFGGDLTRALFPAARIWGPAFDPESDLALSPFPLRAHGIGPANRRRDSVIFALADRIFAAYLKPGGQMEKECLAAAARNQRVLLHTDGAAVYLDSEHAFEPANLQSREAVSTFLEV
jgi:hypothetical protein